MLGLLLGCEFAKVKDGEGKATRGRAGGIQPLQPSNSSSSPQHQYTKTLAEFIYFLQTLEYVPVIILTQGYLSQTSVSGPGSVLMDHAEHAWTMSSWHDPCRGSMVLARILR